MRFRDEDDAADYAEWQQDDDLALFRIEQAERATQQTTPTPEPEDEDTRCAGCNKRRHTVGGLCVHCQREIGRVAEGRRW